MSECWLEPQVNIHVTQVLEWNAEDVCPGRGPSLAAGGQMAGGSEQTRGRGAQVTGGESAGGPVRLKTRASR